MLRLALLFDNSGGYTHPQRLHHVFYKPQSANDELERVLE